MKKRITSFICLLLSLGIAVTAVGCGPQSNNNGSGNGGGNGGSEHGEIVDVNVRQNENVIEEVTDSNTVFYSNGVSDYKIVVPAGKLSKKYAEGYAAEELQFFVEDGAGIVLPIIEDTGLTFNQNDKYISFGNTTLFNATDMVGTLTQRILRNDGYKIKTYGNTVIINSYGENGMLYSAYGFLQRVMDYNYYAEDVWTMTEEKTVYLKNMNVQDVPDFQQRHINTGASDDAVYTLRLRQHGFQSTKLSVGEGPGWDGSDMSIAQQVLLYTKYIKDHPSWYSGDGSPYQGQPCLSAIMYNYVGDEIFDPTTKTITSPSTGKTAKYDEYVGPDYDIVNGECALDIYMRGVIYNYIAPKPETRIYMMGANDNVNPCNCYRCTELYKEVKCGGQWVMFANLISDKYEEWQASLQEGDLYYEQKDRYMEFAFFAYLFAEASPTNYNPNTNTYTPINDEVICKDNVVVRIAPIYSVNMHLHLDEKNNPGAAEAFNGWNAVTQKLAVWDYGCSFMDALVPYADWGTTKENFLMYREKNVNEIFTQLQSRTSGFGLRAYKMYLRAQLMWNVDQDFYTLTEDFFMNYYGEDAGPIMLEYLYFLQAVFQTFDARNIENGHIYSKVLSDRKCWSYLETRKMGTFFDEAILAIDHLKGKDIELYNKYYTHIKCESLFYMYVLLKNYYRYMTKEEGYAMCDEFEYWRLVAGLKLRVISTKDTSYDGWVDTIKAKF